MYMLSMCKERGKKRKWKVKTGMLGIVFALIFSTCHSLTDRVNQTRSLLVTRSDLHVKDGEGNRSQSVKSNYRHKVEYYFMCFTCNNKNVKWYHLFFYFLWRCSLRCTHCSPFGHVSHSIYYLLLINVNNQV